MEQMGMAAITLPTLRIGGWMRESAVLKCVMYCQILPNIMYVQVGRWRTLRVMIVFQLCKLNDNVMSSNSRIYDSPQTVIILASLTYHMMECQIS